MTIPQLTNSELSEIDEKLRDHGMIAMILSIKYIQGLCPDLEDEQAWEVLQQVEGLYGPLDFKDDILTAVTELYPDL